MSKERLIDLEPQQLGLVKTIIRRHIPGKTVWAYGSRVTWKASDISDLDLAVFGGSAAEIDDLKEAFEESSLLVSVGVMDWESSPEKFAESIGQRYVVVQRELGGWCDVKFSDFCEITRGGSPRPIHDYIVPSGTPWVKIADATNENSRYIFKTKEFIKPEGESKSRVVYPGDFIVSNSATPGLPRFMKIRACIHDGWLLFRKITNINKPFLYYLILKEREAILMQGSGTIFTNLKTDILKNHTVFIPPLSEQKSIAELLSSLDDKIDLLHRQNKTLEDMAQALFRKWFVEDAEEGWDAKPLGKTVDISIGRTPPRKEFQWFSKNQKDWKWISIKDMAESGVYFFNTSEYLTQDAVEKFNIPIIPANTVILSFKMTVGRVGITTEDMLSNEAIAQFKFNSNTPYSKEYLYFYLKTFRYDSLGSTSSIVTSINTAMIRAMMIAIPDFEAIEKFDRVCNPLFEKINFNQRRIHKLINLRDTLSPKIMSGEVRVKHV